jgi:hypothetical protein
MGTKQTMSTSVQSMQRCKWHLIQDLLNSIALIVLHVFFPILPRRLASFHLFRPLIICLLCLWNEGFLLPDSVFFFFKGELLWIFYTGPFAFWSFVPTFQTTNSSIVPLTLFLTISQGLISHPLNSTLFTLSCVCHNLYLPISFSYILCLVSHQQGPPHLGAHLYFPMAWMRASFNTF